jgi:hypothetical protein
MSYNLCFTVICISNSNLYKYCGCKETGLGKFYVISGSAVTVNENKIQHLLLTSSKNLKEICKFSL